jgi:hypothetical protein
MKTVNLQLTLPDDLAQKAEAAGLLTPKAVQTLLSHELSRMASDSAGRKRRPLNALIGAGKRHFGSVEEVDRFINAERDSWES